jgi:uncharacterized protein YqfA (UPF0365 family)
MITFFIAYGLIALILLVVFRKTIQYKLIASQKGVQISWGQVIGQTVRKTLSKDILEAAAIAKKEKLKIEIYQLENHKLASGDPVNVVQSMIEARKKGKRLSYHEAAAIDLASRRISS